LLGGDSIHENGSASDAGHEIHHTIEDVIQSALDAHARLMKEWWPRNGHKKNILDPTHTHVGVGLAYTKRGLRMTEEFIKRYVEFDIPIPTTVQLEENLYLQGKVLNPVYSVSCIVVFYEPFPQPMSIRALNRTYSCGLPRAVDYEYPR